MRKNKIKQQQQRNQAQNLNDFGLPKAKLVYLLRDVADDKENLRKTIIQSEQAEQDIEAQIKLLEQLIKEQQDKIECKKKEAEDYRQYLYELETRKYRIGLFPSFVMSKY